MKLAREHFVSSSPACSKWPSHRQTGTLTNRRSLRGLEVSRNLIWLSRRHLRLTQPLMRRERPPTEAAYSFLSSLAWTCCCCWRLVAWPCSSASRCQTCAISSRLACASGGIICASLQHSCARRRYCSALFATSVAPFVRYVTEHNGKRVCSDKLGQSQIQIRTKARHCRISAHDRAPVASCGIAHSSDASSSES